SSRRRAHTNTTAIPPPKDRRPREDDAAGGDAEGSGRIHKCATKGPKSVQPRRSRGHEERKKTLVRFPSCASCPSWLNMLRGRSANLRGFTRVCVRTRA